MGRILKNKLSPLRVKVAAAAAWVELFKYVREPWQLQRSFTVLDVERICLENQQTDIR